MSAIVYDHNTHEVLVSRPSLTARRSKPKHSLVERERYLQRQKNRERKLISFTLSATYLRRAIASRDGKQMKYQVGMPGYGVCWVYNPTFVSKPSDLTPDCQVVIRFRADQVKSA